MVTLNSVFALIDVIGSYCKIEQRIANCTATFEFKRIIYSEFEERRVMYSSKLTPLKYSYLTIHENFVEIDKLRICMFMRPI